MPMGIPSVDYVNGRDAVLIERDVIVLHGPAHGVGIKGRAFQLMGNAPDSPHQIGSPLPGIRINGKVGFFAGNHIEKDGGAVKRPVAHPAISPAKMFGAEEILITLFEDVLFAVKEDKIDTDVELQVV